MSYLTLRAWCQHARVSVIDLEGRGILRAGGPLVVELGGRDGPVSQPIADLGDVGAVLQCVGGSGGPEAVGADRGRVNSCRDGVVFDDVCVDGGTGKGPCEGTAWIPDRAEQGPIGVVPMTNRLEVLLDERGGEGVDGEVADACAFSVDGEGWDPSPKCVIRDTKRAQLRPPKGVE